MNEYAEAKNEYTEANVFPNNSGFNSRVETNTAPDNHAPTASGTFPLRRARYFAKTGTPLLNAGHQSALTNLVAEIDPDTKQRIIALNLRLVVNVAKRYINRGLDLIDLVRAGNQGLIHAMEAFEPEGGYCLSSFISLCVSQQIEFTLVNQNTTRNSQATPVLTNSFENVAQRPPRKLSVNQIRCSLGCL